MFGGRGMGGGSGAGGGMLRTFGRAVTRAGVTGGGGLQEPLSSATTTTTTGSNGSSTTTTSHTSRPTHKSKSKSKSSSHRSLYSSASPFSSYNSLKSASSTLPTWRYVSQGDECEWVYVDQIEDERAHGFFDDYALGPVPSEYEVQTAVSALQQVFEPASYAQIIRDKYTYGLDKDLEDKVINPGLLCQVSSDGSELDWMEPSSHECSSGVIRHHGSDRVYDAFHLLQTEPSVQRMVKSLSSDKAVWDAVLNNNVVRELRESFYADEDNSPASPIGTCDDDSEEKATNIVKLIFENVKMKIKEVIEKLSKVVTELFQAPEGEKIAGEPTDPFNEKLRTSFLLSIMVLLVVVVTRAQKA